MTRSKEGLNLRLTYVFRVLAVALIFGLAPTLPDSNGNTVVSRLAADAVLTSLMSERLEEAKSITASFQELTGQTENPHYRPYVELLRAGVEDFRQSHPDIPVRWETHPDYLSDYDLPSILLTPLSESGDDTLMRLQEGEVPLLALLANLEDPTIQLDVTNTVIARLPEILRRIIADAEDNRFDLAGTPLVAKLGRPHPSNPNNIYVPKEEIRAYYYEIKDQLEELYLETNAPLTQPQLIAFFLEKNQGNLTMALLDLTGFLKYMIRGHNQIGDKLQVDWLQKYILDQVNSEFSLNLVPDFSQLDREDQADFVSLLGLFYHQPHLVSLLPYFSPTLIHAATYDEYEKRMQHIAEDLKALADYSFLRGLPDIIAYLDSLS